MEGNNKDGEISKSQRQWRVVVGGGVISTPHRARAGIRCRNKKRELVRRIWGWEGASLVVW